MRTLKTALCGAFAAAMALAMGGLAAQAATLVDNSTSGYYNSGIGTSLNGTNPYMGTFLFPTTGDPLLLGVPEPDLSTAAASLGSWLTTPSTPGGSWGGLGAVPKTWTVGDEVAVMYEIDAGATGLSNVIATFGNDNGIFVWLDGVYMGGELRPGGVSLGEFVLNLGSLSAGTHFLQILLEDHGGATGFSVLVTGDDAPAVPLPAAIPFFLTGMATLGVMRKRRRKGCA